MTKKRMVALLLTAVALAAILCACATNGVKGEWKNDKMGMRIVFDDNKTGILYTPMFGTELVNELTYTVDGDQLTIGFINSDGTISDEIVVVKDGAFTYTGLDFIYQS